MRKQTKGLGRHIPVVVGPKTLRSGGATRGHQAGPAVLWPESGRTLNRSNKGKSGIERRLSYAMSSLVGGLVRSTEPE
jgi:hypothetical protein